MKLGVIIFATDYSIQMDEMARELEDRGYESLFVPEHSHIPTSRLSPWPGGAELPKEYSHCYDPFVALSFAAAATQNLKVGTGICLLPQRDTIATAKSVASLDRMSNGRFLFGIGAGWNREEMEQHGTDYASRYKKLGEQVRAMKRLWQDDVAEFHGDHIHIEPSWQYPKPVQTPSPPVLLGGETDHTLRRIVDFCEGWMPRTRNGFDIVEHMPRLKHFADAAGRDMSTISVSIFGAPPKQDILDRYQEAGVTRSIIALPPADRDKVLSLLDRYQHLEK